MNPRDPEQRIAELERQLAEQRRIAELERQLAEAKAAAHQHHAAADEHARQFGESQFAESQFAESWWEGVRTGAPTGPGGLSAPEMAQHREAFVQAATQAGLSQEQIDNIFARGKATFSAGYSVGYPGQVAVPGDSAGRTFRTGSGMGPPAGFAQRVGSRYQVAQGRRRPLGLRGWPDRIGAILGAIGICTGAAASLTAMMPSSALWTSPFVCDSGYQLNYSTSNYSYKPGQSGTSVSFQCVGASDSYEPSWLAIGALQTVLVTLVLGAAVAVGFVVWHRLFKAK